MTSREAPQAQNGTQAQRVPIHSNLSVFDLAGVTIDFVFLILEDRNSARDMRCSQEILRKSRETDQRADHGEWQYKAIQFEMWIREPYTLKIKFTESVKLPAPVTRIDIQLSSIRYMQIIKSQHKLIIDCSRINAYKEKPNQEFKLEQLIIPKTLPSNNVRFSYNNPPWSFVLKFDPESFERFLQGHYLFINKYFKQFGVRIIDEHFPFRELNSKQEEELAELDQKLRKTSLADKKKELSKLSIPKFSQHSASFLTCPLYTCLSKMSNGAELKAHIQQNHKELEKFKVSVAEDGTIELPEELVNMAMLAENFFKDFTKQLVLDHGNAKFKKLLDKSS